MGERIEAVAGTVSEAVADAVQGVVDVLQDTADAALSVGGRRRPRRQPGQEDGRRSRWDKHRQVRRDELIDAAIAAVGKHGTHVGMDQIAAEAKTSKPVLYRYFADRTAVYQAVGRRVAGRVVSGFVAAIDTVDDARGVLAACVDSYLQVAEESPDVYRFVVHHPGEPGEDEQDFTAVVTTLVSDQLAVVLERIGIDPRVARPAGAGHVGFMRAVTEWWLDHRDAMTRPELTEYVTAYLWGGLAGLHARQGVRVDAKPPKGLFPTK